MKKKKQKNYKLLIVLIPLFILFLISSIYFIYILNYFNGVENNIRYIVIGGTILLDLFFFLLIFRTVHRVKKHNLFYYIVFVLSISIAQFIIAFNANKVIGAAEKLINKNTTYSSSLIVIKNNGYKDIKDLKNSSIGIINNKDDIAGYQVSMKIVEDNNIDLDNLVEYDSYITMLQDLYDDNIDAIFVNSSYKTMFSTTEGFENIGHDTKVIISKYEVYKNKDSLSKDESLDKPFSVLLLGVDSEKNGISSASSFNGDALILLTFNPSTMNATILSIPRDTYVPIACFKNNKKNKITNAGWQGEKCVIDTVSNFTGIDIDYWVKINFKGLVDLVDAIGGVEVDVPYTFCEQDSNRNWGESTVLVDKGLQTLNGEQALALSRHRKLTPEFKRYCGSYYDPKVFTNDFVRGQNQQLVLNGIANKAKNVRSLNKVYKLLDVVSNNMKTNLSKKTILSSYDIFKKLILNSSNINNSDFIGTQRLYLSGYDKNIYDPDIRRELYNFVYYEGSLKDVKEAMLINLEVEEPRYNKSFEFDINKVYKEEIVGKGSYRN